MLQKNKYTNMLINLNTADPNGKSKKKMKRNTSEAKEDGA